MPPICLHLAIAEEAAERLHHPVMEGRRGEYLLGATLPDVHLISGISREETHFVKLENSGGESGVKLLFLSHPELDKDAVPGEEVKAMVAGYLSHLVTDETWIKEVYLPFFSASSPLRGNPLSSLMDRVLQYELDCRERRNKARMAIIQEQLCRWNSKAGVGFLSSSVLTQWHSFVCAATSREPTWERFHIFAQRFLIPSQKVDREQLEKFLASLPPQEEELFRYVPREHIIAFREKAINLSMMEAQEYLN